MIIDNIKNANIYYPISKYFEKAFQFLQTDLSILKPGRHDIDGENVFAILIETDGVSEEKAVFESHKRYIDLHYTITGNDRIGWTPNFSITQEYNEKDDYMFHKGPALNWNIINEKYFAIFFPQDVHAATVDSGTIRKIVVKILLE